MSLYTKCIRCLLDTNKYNKHTETVLRMDNAQKNNLRLPAGPSIERQRLRIMTTRSIV